MVSTGIMEDAAMKAVYALRDIPADEVHLRMLLTIRFMLNDLISKAMEMQNEVAADG